MNQSKIPASDATDFCERIASEIANEDIDFWKLLIEEIGVALKDKQASGSPENANFLWHIRTVCIVICDYLNTFEKLKNGEYREAWDRLEQIEIAISAVKYNQISDVFFYQLEFIKDRVQDWQELYPYKVFASPEFIIEKAECSICGLLVTPWSPCEHIPRKVYNGEMCTRIIRGAKFISIALVLDPVQKYSVLTIPGPDGEDTMDYRLVETVINSLKSPFDGWSLVKTTRRIPHKYFEADRGDPCPCDSGKEYEHCCMHMSGVIRPHFDVIGLTELDNGESGFQKFFGKDEVHDLNRQGI
ncbi:MAG: YecA family protein [Parasphingopyxis sp.]|uniref:YecA family protein n=1 Tax=Parasphingopyxis sp. TaxID=1920299 RepID=UPI003FA09673